MRSEIRSLTEADLENRPLTQAIDDLLRRSRRDLLPSDARLEPVEERIAETSVDPARILAVALQGKAVTGVVDARFGWPSPRDLTIEHIAVLRALRGQGRGRALVGAALDVAQSRFGEVDQLYAAVLQAHGSAAVFWRNLGLCPVGSDPCVFSGPANPLLPERTQRHEDMRR